MSRLVEAGRFLRLFTGPRNNRASEIYDLLSTRNNLGERSLFLNLGYWDGPRTYDDACRRLAEVLGEAAGTQKGSRVLDCGCGFGDAAMYWLGRFGPATIDGLNISASQVATARERVGAAGLGARICIHLGSATRMPFANASFDRVLALETAFHYDTRDDFFREAVRVLKPGGRLATADIIPMEGRPTPWWLRVGERLGRSFWQIPDANMVPRAEYARRMSAAGLADVRVESIAERVYAPFAAFAKERLRAPEIRERMNPLVRWSWAATVRPMAKTELDYVIAVGEKRP